MAQQDEFKEVKPGDLHDLPEYEAERKFIDEIAGKIEAGIGDDRVYTLLVYNTKPSTDGEGDLVMHIGTNAGAHLSAFALEVAFKKIRDRALQESLEEILQQDGFKDIAGGLLETLQKVVATAKEKEKEKEKEKDAGDDTAH